MRQKRSEQLFEAEAMLRLRANDYSTQLNNTTRKNLRDAAIAYAMVAAIVDRKT